MFPSLPFFPFPSSTVQVANGGITAASLAANAIADAAIAANAITAAKFAAGTLANIASIRRDTIALAALTASNFSVLDPIVNPARCEARLLGVSRDTSNDPNLSDCQVRLQIDGDGDSITASRGVSTQAVTVGWEITEWK